MINSWSFARKMAFGLALGPLALIVVGLIAFLNIRGLLNAEQALVQSFDVGVAISSMNQAVAASESAERGYILTGDQDYINIYQRNVKLILDRLDGLAQLTVNNATQQQRISTVRSFLTERLGQLQSAIAARQAHGFAAAVAAERANRAHDNSSQIEEQMAAVLTEEERVQADLQSADQRSSAQTLSAIVFATIAACLLLGAIAFLLIRSVSRPVGDAVAALASATAEILAGTSQQAAGVQEQAAAVAETVSTVEQIAQTADASSERARTVAETAQRAVENGAAGRQAVEDTVAVMADVKARTESIANNILSLAEQAQAIGEIIAVVTDVADQTNILALNAAIEASRAGEHGKGFSVVAAEVKSLADQSKKATVQVRQILSDIQRATNSAVLSTEEGAKTVDDAIRSVSDADDAIRSLANVIAEAAQSATQISASVNQQSIGIAQIRRAMRDINETTVQSLASTRQAEQSARDLDDLGHRLQRLLHGAPA